MVDVGGRLAIPRRSTRLGLWLFLTRRVGLQVATATFQATRTLPAIGGRGSWWLRRGRSGADGGV